MTTTELRPPVDVTTVEVAAQWVKQHNRLWTGRLNGRPIGTIERGRRFTYIDPDGAAMRGFRTLADAQRAHLTADHLTEGETVSMARAERMLMAATTVAAFGTVGLIVAAVPVLR